MEQFFDLNNVQNTQKVRMETVYLEPNQFVWYQWLFSRKKIITWAIFTEELIAHYEDTKSNTFFSQMIRVELHEEDPNINMVLRSGTATGEEKRKVTKDDAKVCKEIDVEARESFAEVSTSGIRD